MSAYWRKNINGIEKTVLRTIDELHKIDESAKDERELCIKYLLTYILDVAYREGHFQANFIHAKLIPFLRLYHSNAGVQ